MNRQEVKEKVKEMKGRLMAETITLPEAQEAAQKMIHDSRTLVQNVRIRFQLVFITDEGQMHIIPCTWHDPFHGFFFFGDSDRMTRVKEAKEIIRDYRVMKNQTLEPVK